MARTRLTRVRKVRFWRWRHNPLRRRSDSVEAWIILATWIVALVGGLLAGSAADGAMQDSLAARRATVHAVPAELTENADRTETASTDGGGGDTVWGKVRWTTADGSTHTGLTRVDPSSTAGTSVTVWIDSRGELAGRPPTEGAARVQSALTGLLGAAGAGGVALGCGRVARLRLDRWRIRAWEAEWERVGPQWRKKMSG
ncbi:Rv1733c family protein [Streptomyces sp. NPDC001492]